jgi:hypothetical protein
MIPHRETVDTFCFDCWPYSNAGEVAYHARLELIHFSVRAIPHITCLSVILQWGSFVSSARKNSHKLWEMNVRVIPVMKTPCVYTYITVVLNFHSALWVILQKSLPKL